MLVEAKFLGARISEVPVAYRERVGCTKLNPLKDGMRILGTMIRLMRDTQPLLFFGGIGVFLGVIGLVLGIEVTLEWLRTGAISRIPTVMLSVLLMVSSMQFFTLGLVADMIKRLRRNVCSTYKHEF
jgi:dolichol-phosphate mannosyltransferase